MATKSLPSPEVIRQLLRYEPETGKLFWLPRPVEMFRDGFHSADHMCRSWNSKFAGEEAFCTPTSYGYRCGGVFRIRMLSHRVAWAMMTGAWPVDEIDHINGDPADNRWGNLRLATSSQNKCNRRMAKNNTSGVVGVDLHRASNRWRARVAIAGKVTSLGYFDSIEQAAAARADAVMRIHGPFAKIG